jgi:predicted N-acetyltransferase YhbS
VPDVRSETGADHEAIWHVHERAFAPSIGEAKLVDELRAAGDLVPELCLVRLTPSGELDAAIPYPATLR